MKEHILAKDRTANKWYKDDVVSKAAAAETDKAVLDKEEDSCCARQRSCCAWLSIKKFGVAGDLFMVATPQKKSDMIVI